MQGNSGSSSAVSDIILIILLHYCHLLRCSRSRAQAGGCAWCVVVRRCQLPVARACGRSRKSQERRAGGTHEPQ